MDDETRKRIDESALRLLGYKQNDALPSLWFGPYDSVSIGKDGPSQDARHVAPLAEALRARGYHLKFIGSAAEWTVLICRAGDREMISKNASTLPLALALAASRTVGEK